MPNNHQARLHIQREIALLNALERRRVATAQELADASGIPVKALQKHLVELVEADVVCRRPVVSNRSLTYLYSLSKVVQLKVNWADFRGEK